MATEQISFDKVLRLTQKLLQIQDLDLLLEEALTEAINTVDADAGSIYLVEGTTLKFSYTQNKTLQKKLVFGKKLVYSTFSIPINNQSIAGYVANTGLITNIPDAYRIDSFQPYSFNSRFDETSGYRTQSMLSVPIKNSAKKVIGVIQLINSIGLDKMIHPFSTSEESIVQLFADSTAIAIEHAQMLRSMIIRMNKMVELHEPAETAEHTNRVSAYSVEIYEAWAHKKGIPEREIHQNRDLLRMAAMLHDIGKIAIPTKILKKNRKDLTPEEKTILQSHTIEGAKLFPNSASLFEEVARVIALNHHEKWDGSGYPGHVSVENGKPLPGYEKADGSAFGKRGIEIPLFARIVAVANSYDALMSNFSIDLPDEKAREEKVTQVILAESGKQFDPDIVVAFLGCSEVIRSIRSRYPNKP